MRWSFPLKQRRCCSIAFFQRIGPLPCCWLDSVVAWGASGPRLSSSTVAVQGISLLLRGLPPPPLLSEVFVQAHREQMQTESVSWSFLQQDCANVLVLVPGRSQYRDRNEWQGHEQLGIFLALVFGLFCLRAYVKLLTWLFLASQICSARWGAADSV